MTSGVFHSLPIEEVQVDRASRQRRVIKDIETLAESIRNRGLIHPIVVDRDKFLIAGERRLMAVRSLGWTHITVQYADALTEFERRAIELEENVKREDISWQDQCLAVEALHELHKSQDPDWTVEKTADSIGITRPAVQNQLSVAKEIRSGNQRVIEAPRYSIARGIVQRKHERLRVDELQSLKETISPDKEEEAIYVRDFIEWSATYDGPKFNFLHCDFPYGIGSDKFDQGSASSFGGYRDTPDNYRRLVNTLIERVDRFCGDSCHILFWFSLTYYAETLEALRRAFTIDPFPLIWFRSDNRGILPAPEYGPRRVYETAFFGYRGGRKIIQAVSNVCANPVAREGAHMSEKPEEMLRHFFRMVVDTNTSMLDPTCGSGSALRAAESLGASRIVGLEINEEFAANARGALMRSRLSRGNLGERNEQR